ncbi:MAG: serine/threonine-protein kinase, partial [Thermoguttaceae bacterium]|nr:serine/threonine-protein kinase [Thermoguttaceae bacterium]
MNELVKTFLETTRQLRLVRRLGRGGFGEVWEVESPFGIRSALKVSLDPLDVEDATVKKELESLRLVKELSGHPHVVTLLDVWEVSGYLVTRWELADGGSLQDVLQRYKREGQSGIPVAKLLRYMADAAAGIDFLNSKGVYHRDIKPSNLLLFHGRVKVGDLGLIKLAGASTASHSGVGTMGYLPPEAFQHGALSPTVDLYSLAATYLHLRTGQPPFGTNPAETIQRQLEGKHHLEGLNPKEAELLRKALAPRPEDRPREGVLAWVRQLASLWQEKAPFVSPSTPAPARKVQPDSPIRISCDGSGDFPSLAEAVAVAAPGQEILLGPGTHRLTAPLEITRGVRIRGAGMDRTRVVGVAEGFVLRLNGPGFFELQDISFEYGGDKGANV